MSQDKAKRRTGLDTVRRTLRMAARFRCALERGNDITGVTLQAEFELSPATVKRFIRLYREEFDDNFEFDPYQNSYRRRSP